MMKRDEASASLDGARVRAGDAFRDGLEVKERVSWRARRGEVKNDERRSEDHASSPDIPFNKLLPSKARMRRVNAGVSIEQLAENIALRTLLRGLNVRMRPACSRFRPRQALSCTGASGPFLASFATEALPRMAPLRRIASAWVVPYSSQRGAGMQRRSPFLLGEA